MAIDSILTVAGEFIHVSDVKEIQQKTGLIVMQFKGTLAGTADKTAKLWEVPIHSVVAIGRSFPGAVLETVPQTTPVTDKAKPSTVEYFVFGKCAGLALDGSLGFGPCVTQKAFSDYVEWYNTNKADNARWIKMKESGEIFVKPMESSVSTAIFGSGTATPEEKDHDDLPF